MTFTCPENARLTRYNLRQLVPDARPGIETLLTEPFSGPNGAFYVRGPLATLLLCIASDGAGWLENGLPGVPWEHVSVSARNRIPAWTEMAYIKDLFWSPEDCVVQFHPPVSDYVNCHPNCLHLWRPVGVELLRPPSLAVGPK